MRILFVGYCNDVYVGYLASILKDKDNAIQIGVIDFVARGNTLDERYVSKVDRLYSSYVEPRQMNFDNILKNLIYIFRNRKLIGKRQLLTAIFNKKISVVCKEIQDRTNQIKVVEHKKGIFADFAPTHVHFHFLDSNTLDYLQYVQPGLKVILSFWGSDLMDRSGGSNEFQIQLSAIERADVITTQSIETRTILLSKFGQRFRDKVRLALFNPLANKDFMLELVDDINVKQKTKAFYRVPENNICIQVGYSGASTQRHVEILEVLNTISEIYKKQITFFLPVTYTGFPDYVQELEKYAAQTTLDCRVLTKFLTDEEIFKVVNVCDFLICLRDNDAGNAAMVESLHAGNCVVTGAWLPYKMYSRAGVYFEEVESIGELSSLMPELLNNLDTVKGKCRANRVKVESLYDKQKIKENWYDVYNP